MQIIINWLLYTIAIGVTAYILPGVMLSGFVSALILAVVLGAINAVVKPILLLITLPINIITLGLFTFVINALLIMLAGLIVPGFGVSGFWSAMLFAVVLSLVNWVIGSFGKKDEHQ